MHFFNPAPLMPLVEVVSGLATIAGGGRDRVRDGAGVGQDAGARGVDAGLHRQPLRAAVLRRGAAAARRARRRRRDDRRRDARGGRLSDGTVRAHGPHRPRRQPRGDEERLGGVLPRSALRAVGAAAGARRRRLPRPQDRARLLRLRARARRKPVPRNRGRAARARRASSRRATLGVAAALARAHRRRRRERRARARRSRDFRGRDSLSDGARPWLALTDGRTATGAGGDCGVRDLVLFDLALDYRTATRLAVAAADTCSDAAFGAAVGALQAAGIAVSRLDDVAGLAVMRTVAMLANEAADAVVQGVATARESTSRCRRASTIRAGRSRGPMRSALEHVRDVLAQSRRALWRGPLPDLAACSRGAAATGGKLGG